MFFDKLWVRMKGELLAFKEDFPGAQEIREKGELLLQELERRWRDFVEEKQDTRSADAETEEPSEREIQAPAPLQDIEREWEALLRLREEKKQNSEEDEASPPNPRTLG
jgi:hypothetical protein